MVTVMKLRKLLYRSTAFAIGLTSVSQLFSSATLIRLKYYLQEQQRPN